MADNVKTFITCIQGWKRGIKLERKCTYGLIGYPLGHSLSPALHNFIYNYYNIYAQYVLMETQPHKLYSAVDNIRSSGIKGVNVTIPYKESIIKYIDRVDDVSKTICAVNTLINNNGFLEGCNTDYKGFSKSLELHGLDVKGRDVFIIGSGGSSKAVSYALSLFGCVIHIFNRDKAHLDENYFKDLSKSIEIYNINELSEKLKIIKPYLLINCTPVGMKGYTGSFDIKKSDILGNVSIIYDLVYNPRNTPLMELGRTCGISTISGIDMLLFQAFESIKIWTGVNIDFKLAKRELEKQGII